MCVCNSYICTNIVFLFINSNNSFPPLTQTAIPTLPVKQSINKVSFIRSSALLFDLCLEIQGWKWRSINIASSSASLFQVSLVFRPCLRRRLCHPMKVKAQSFREEESSRNTVDANMSLLRKRIDEVRMKERLERCCRSELGWNYAAEYNPKLRRDKAATELFELVSLSFGTIAFTLISCTAFLCLASLLAHL
ncbi:uncharacterized protein LOC116202796 [Punica granatum]|uniref:Uncharacterized protein LOC116202796 n=1 Tax=Punica granatum TaxID=22663 RepID=A0A6P8D1J4_PUNGR|nr:uncharacterized protein LOC116202796 [Punica granatum]